MRRAPFAVILLATSTLLVGQETNVQTAKTAGTPKTKVTAPAAKPKLTEQQKRGLNLLESAEDAAGGFEATSRIVAYTQIARVYQANNKKKAVDLLQQAYDCLRTLQLDSPNKNLNRSVTMQLQQQVLSQFISVAPERVDAFMDQMNARDAHDCLGRADALLREEQESRPSSGAGDANWAGAGDAVLDRESLDRQARVPRTRSKSANSLWLRSRVIRIMTTSNLHHPEKDLRELISKVYGKVPDDVVSTAIDEVLSQAKKGDANAGNVNVQLGYDSGAVQFKSIYDYRLFSVLPVLEQIDPEKAKKLLKESQDVSTFASKYPEGANSLSKNGRPNSIMLNTGKSATLDKDSPNAMEEQRSSQIVADSAVHPNDALANVAALSPPYALRAYIGIARANVKKNSSATESALGKAQDLLSRVLPIDQMRTVSDIIYLYEELGDNDNARKAIESGTKTAAALYKQETDAEDPNAAPKAYWLSTNAWRNLVEASYELDPTDAVTLLKEVSDDEIRVFTQISLAKRMLGSKGTGWDYSMTARKNGMIMSMSTNTAETEESK